MRRITSFTVGIDEDEECIDLPNHYTVLHVDRMAAPSRVVSVTIEHDAPSETKKPRVFKVRKVGETFQGTSDSNVHRAQARGEMPKGNAWSFVGATSDICGNVRLLLYERN